MANFPNSVPSFTTKNNGDVIQPSHVNGIQDEVVAIGDALLNGWTPINWQSFTPTWTNLTLGNGVASGKYFLFGDLVVFRVDLVFGTTTSVSGAINVNYPVAAETGASFTIGHGEAIDASTGDSFSLHARLVNGTRFTTLTDNGTKLVDTSGTVPFTWTTSDELHLLGAYEAA